MSYRQQLSKVSPKNGFSLLFESLPAWIAILGLALFSVACISVGAGSLLRILFPLGSLLVGVFLYFRYPILYIGFTWWLWILTPLLARIVDHRSGWDPQRLMLISPYLATLVTFITFVRYMPASYRQGGLPFILAFVGVVYGFLVGVINNTPFTAARSLLDWLSPIVFAFHLFINWRDYPKYSQIIQRTFIWGVLVTGIYGIVQYLIAPEWDRFWLIESKLTSSAGSPEPLGIRVWSTMHSPGAFGLFMMAGLILLFSGQGFLRLPAAAFGYLSFLLSLVRSAWGGYLVALLILLSSVKARLQMRLITTILIVAILALPLTTLDPFAKVISSRLETFSNLSEDQSFNARSENYDKNLSIALSTALGKGLGSVWTINKQGNLQVIVLDSGILDTFFTIGWFGAIPYLGGMMLIIVTVIQYTESRFDPFMSAARALGLSFCSQLIISSVMIGIGGLMLWGFLALSMAAHKYYQHQKIMPKQTKG